MSKPDLLRRARLAAAGSLSLLGAGLPAQSFAYVHGGVGYRCEAAADDVAWFSFEGGVIRYTIDGGATIANANVPADVRGTLRGFHMGRDAGGPWGYCVGDNGVVLFSDDAGRTWTQKTPVVTSLAHLHSPGVRPQLWDVHFTSRTHGFVVGFEHTIRETNDGGDSWVDVAPPSGHVASDNPEWYQLHVFANGDLVTVADNGWYLHREASGSIIANEVDVSGFCYLPPGIGPWNLEIWALDFVGDDGIAVGGVVHGHGYVLRSTDAGRTWALDTACFDLLGTQLDGFPPATLYDVDLFGDPAAGIAVGYGSLAMVGGTAGTATPVSGCSACAPTGKAWVQTVCDSDQNSASDPEDDGAGPLLRGVCSSDSFDAGYAVGDFGVVRRTDDQGQTWTELQGLHRSRIQSGTFCDANIGVLGAQEWRVFTTVDGGASFSLDYAQQNIPLDPTKNPPSPYFGYFNDVALAAVGDRAVVVGDQGRIAVRDASNTWHDRSIGTWGSAPRLFAALADASGTLMLVAGERFGGNSLHLSVDGGATAFTPMQLTWQSQPVTDAVVDLAFDGTYVYYLTAGNVYIANPAVSLTAAVVVVPIVGTSGAATCLGVRSSSDFWAGNAVGQVFRVDVATVTMQPVAQILPALLGTHAGAITATPGAADWWFTGSGGRVVRFDGASYTRPKSSIADDVVDSVFFPGGAGLLIGRKINIAKW